MFKKRKAAITIAILVLSNVITIFYYESKKNVHQQFEKIIGGESENKIFTANDIKKLIYTDTIYINDSIRIIENGDLVSSNDKFQSTFNAFMRDNETFINNESETKHLPKLYIVYKNAAFYYRQAHPEEFSKKKHSSDTTISN